MTDLFSGSPCRTVSDFVIIDRHTGTFKHWKASGQAIFLKKKVVLVPGLDNANGLVYARNVRKDLF